MSVSPITAAVCSRTSSPVAVLSKNRSIVSVWACPRTNCSTDDPSPGTATSAYSLLRTRWYSGGLNITGTSSGTGPRRTTITALDNGTSAPSPFALELLAALQRLEHQVGHGVDVDPAPGPGRGAGSGGGGRGTRPRGWCPGLRRRGSERELRNRALAGQPVEQRFHQALCGQAGLARAGGEVRRSTPGRTGAIRRPVVHGG